MSQDTATTRTRSRERPGTEGTSCAHTWVSGPQAENTEAPPPQSVTTYYSSNRKLTRARVLSPCP